MSPVSASEGTARSAPSERFKWSVALVIAALLYGLASYYIFALLGTSPSLASWAAVTAAVASLMFALSLSASSVSHYLGWPNMRDGYQKQIGVTAFWLSFVYSLMLLVLYPETYWYGFAENFWSADVLMGLSAMGIFGAMTLANSKWVAPHVSWETIKFILGLGFVAYALLVIRAIFIEWGLWEAWLSTFDGYPPSRLVISVLALLVLCLRLSVPIHKAHRHTN